MDIDATQVIDDIDINVAEKSRQNEGCPVGFLKLLKQKNFEEKSFPIFEGINKVGRAIACHVAVQSKTLSKEHCCIEVFHDDHFIYDLGSSNKSRRNKTVLTPNVRYELNNSDVLTLADLKFIYIKSCAVHMGNSGSDTESLPESESLIPVSWDNVATGGAFEPQAADDDNDDDDDDPSSDILQPTQHAGGHLIGSHNQMQAFLEDSLRHVMSENKEKKSLADETVLETPPRVLLGASLSDDFIPESDSETEAGYHCLKATTSEYNDADVEEKVKSIAVASNEPTQAYSIDFASEVVDGSECLPNLTSFPAETLVLSDADVAATQVFSASAQKSDADSAATQVFSQFPVESSQTPSPVHSKMFSKLWKSAEQDTVPYNADLEETQVVVDPSCPVALCNSKVPEKSDTTDRATKMYIEETQLYEDETATVVKVPFPIDKPRSPKEKIVRESNDSVINFSPQSASTQVFDLDAETSFLPTLVLETSDRLDADDNQMLLSLPVFPITTICSSSENLVRCTGLNSTRNHLSTDNISSKEFSGKEAGQLLDERVTADDFCTQVYEDTDWHPYSSSGAVAKSSTYTDDICTQVYQDKDGNISGSGVAAVAKSSTCTADVLTQDCNTNQPLDFVLENMQPVSSTPNLSTCNPSISTTSSLSANEVIVTTDRTAVNEISERGLPVKSHFLQTRAYQSELITEEPGRISNVVSESGITVSDAETVEDRDSDNRDDLATQIFDFPKVEKKIRGKQSKEEKKVISVGSEVSDTWPATRKSTVQKKGRKSSRKKFLMESKAQAIFSDEETKGHSSSGSNQPCINSLDKKNEELEQEVFEHANAARLSKEKDKEKIMISYVSVDSGPSHVDHSEMRDIDSSSVALGRRTSMRQNKGKRPEDTEFRKPVEGKRKSKKGSKRQIKDLESPTVESPSKKICSDPEVPLIAKSLSEDLDSRSSRGTRESEILESSQMSDDDLPSLSSLMHISRIQDATTRRTLSEVREPRLAMIAENENAKPVCELESEEALGKDTTEDEIMKKEPGNNKKMCLGSKRKPITETNLLSEDESPAKEWNDPITDETTKKEPRNKKKMSLGSKKYQRTEKKDLEIEERNVWMEDETTESDNKKKVSLGSKKNKCTSETAQLPTEGDSVGERKSDDHSDDSKGCESVAERDMSEGAVVAGQKTSQREAGVKQMFSDSVTQNSAEENMKSSESWKNVKKTVTERSSGGKNRVENSSALIEIPVRSKEVDSSQNSHLSSHPATLTKGSTSKLSGELEMESDPSSSSDHSSRGRRLVWSAVIASENKVAGLSQRKRCKALTASTENLVDSGNEAELLISGRKGCSTLASDLSVAKETIEVVPERSELQNKNHRALVAECEDDLTCKESSEDLLKAKLLQPSSELETESARLAGTEETKRTTRGRKRTTEREVFGLSLRKQAKPAAAAAADSEETGNKKMSNSGTKFQTSAKKSCQTRASDLDERVVMESSKELERKTVAGQKNNRFGAGEVVDSQDAKKPTEAKSSVTRKNRLSLLMENDGKVMKKSSSSSDKEGSKMLETEDSEENDDKPGSKLSAKKTKRRTVAAKNNVNAIELSLTEETEPVSEESGSRRGKKTKPGVGEDLQSERHEVAASCKQESRNMTTSLGIVSSEKPEMNVVVEDSAQRLQGTNRKGKKVITSNETDKEDDAQEKMNVGSDSKRLRKSRKPLTEEDPKPDERVMTPDLAKGARRRTKSGVEPKVMFTGVVDENGQKTVKSLGGEMVESIYDCTHLVTDQVRRTVKFLCGVARGLPIVSPKWLEASHIAGRFLDPSEFLVSDTENEKKFNFSLEWTLKEAAKRPLLLGSSVHVTENVRPDPKQMKDIIQCAGGKFVQDLPKSVEDNLIVVTCDGKDLQSCSRLEGLGVPLVSSEYIMMGILQQKLDANLYRLTTKKSAETVKRNTPEMSAGSRKKQRK